MNRRSNRQGPTKRRRPSFPVVQSRYLLRVCEVSDYGLVYCMFRLTPGRLWTYAASIDLAQRVSKTDVFETARSLNSSLDPEASVIYRNAKNSEYTKNHRNHVRYIHENTN
jgi:hypothetical protein